MAHQERTPSVKLVLDKDQFNQLVSMLDQNISLQVESEKANKLKEKLLRYSIPRTNDDNMDIIDVRFFPNEASNIIMQLLLQSEKSDIMEDYYCMLIHNRANKLKKI